MYLKIRYEKESFKQYNYKKAGLRMTLFSSLLLVFAILVVNIKITLDNIDITNKKLENISLQKDIDISYKETQRYKFIKSLKMKMNKNDDFQNIIYRMFNDEALTILELENIDDYDKKYYRYKVSGYLSDYLKFWNKFESEIPYMNLEIEEIIGNEFGVKVIGKAMYL